MDHRKAIWLIKPTKEDVVRGAIAVRERLDIHAEQHVPWWHFASKLGD
jgi:hypothetical protein